MDWTRWREHFEHNRTRALPDLRDAARGLPQDLIPVLASTIARLQAGETGEGRIVHQVHEQGFGDADYQEAMRLFVAEEGRHAAILGRALKALGGESHRDHWTARYFMVGRRLIGVRTKLMVLLAAEVIAVKFYEAMAAAMPPGPLREAFEQVGADEIGHLEFHSDFFAHEAATPAARAAFRAAWWPTASACCAVVLGDHAATLSALGVDRGALFRSMLTTIAHVDRRVAGLDEPRWTDAGTADARAEGVEAVASALPSVAWT